MNLKHSRMYANLAIFLRKRRLPISRRSDEVLEPVFVVGSGRSGSTLLRRGLVEHAAIHIPPETYELGRIIRFFLNHNDAGWSNVVRHALGSFSLNDEFENTFGYSLTGLRRSLDGVPKEERSLCKLLSEFYEYDGKQKGIEARRWGDKTPLNTFSVFLLKKVFPRAYFIWLIRDPVDVVASYLKSEIYNDAYGAMKRWNDSNLIMHQFSNSHGDRVVKVTYESMVGDFESVVSRVCRECGLRYAESRKETRLGDVEVRAHHANVLKPIFRDSIGKGEKELKESVVMDVKKHTSKFYERIISKSKY